MRDETMKEKLINDLSQVPKQIYPTESNLKLSVSKDKMNTLFNKLASNDKIRTLKEKSIDPNQLLLQNHIPFGNESPTKALRNLDLQLGIEDYLTTTDCVSLLSDTNLMNLPVEEINRKENKVPNGLTNTDINETISYQNYSELSKTYNQFIPLNSSGQKEIKTKKMLNTSSKKSLKNKFLNGNECNKSFQLKTPTNKSKASKKIKNTQRISFNDNKQNQLNHSMIITKTKPKMSLQKNIQPSPNNKNNNVNASSCFKNQTQIKDSGNLRTIEEYDHNKLLQDLQGIFGNELEYFDEELLFESLDEQSSKGLIKALLLLANSQGKKIKTISSSLSKTKTQYQSDIKAKDNIISNLTKQLASINQNLKGIITETDQYHTKQYQYKKH